MFSEYLVCAKLWNYKYEQVIFFSHTLEKKAGERYSSSCRKESYSAKQSKEAAATGDEQPGVSAQPPSNQSVTMRTPWTGGLGQDVCQRAAGPQQRSGTGSLAMSMGGLDVNLNY